MLLLLLPVQVLLGRCSARGRRCRWWLLWMVRIKIRLVRLVHHLAAHYTVSVAMHMILSTVDDTSLVKDRRETEKNWRSVGLPCRGRGAARWFAGGGVAAPLRTNSRRAWLSTRSITLAEAPPSNHSCRPCRARGAARTSAHAPPPPLVRYLQRRYANAHTYLLTTLYGKKP